MIRFVENTYPISAESFELEAYWAKRCGFDPEVVDACKNAGISVLRLPELQLPEGLDSENPLDQWRMTELTDARQLTSSAMRYTFGKINEVVFRIILTDGSGARVSFTPRGKSELNQIAQLNELLNNQAIGYAIDGPVEQLIPTVNQ